MGTTTEKKLGLVALTALVTGSIVGSGIFSMPQNMAEGAGGAAIAIAWMITFVGMLSLAKIFQWLSINRPDIDDGVYGYVRSGFGDYFGFNAAWGYWISVWVGNVGYMILLASALGSLPGLGIFGAGDTFPALLLGLAYLWMVHFFVLSGVKSAAMLNIVVTIAKIIPIVLFILFVALAFKIETFSMDFWGTPELGSLTDQVKTTMLYTVWAFLGIEAATVYANRARNMKIVSRATIIGFSIIMVLLMSVSMLSLGVVPQHELAQMKNPSMAGVMAAAVGPWGGVLINVGLALSVSGAMLAWMLLASEMFYLTARGDQHTAPKIFSKLNENKTPAPALWLTTICITVTLIINYLLSGGGYNVMIQLAGSMALIPYLLCASFAFKLAVKGVKGATAFTLFLTALGTVYGIWLIYAGGMSYLLMSLLLYAVGIPFFFKARKERGLSGFGSMKDGILAAIIVVGGLTALVLILNGTFAL